MELVKENKQKQRRVYKDDNRYIKVWDDVKPQWISEHVRLLNKIVPKFVDDYGINYIAYTKIEGVPASNVEHTTDFIKKVYQFCLDEIERTKPYVHGDWVISNIIVKPDNSLCMIDWDNIGIYPTDEYMSKLHRDLHSSFGDRFYDAAGI